LNGGVFDRHDDAWPAVKDHAPFERAVFGSAGRGFAAASPRSRTAGATAIARLGFSARYASTCCDRLRLAQRWGARCEAGHQLAVADDVGGEDRQQSTLFQSRSYRPLPRRRQFSRRLGRLTSRSLHRRVPCRTAAVLLALHDRAGSGVARASRRGQPEALA